MIIHHNIEQNTEDWHNLRMGKFTASMFKDCFAAKSTAAYKNAINDVVFQILTGEVEESYSNAIMQRGHEIEPLAADYYELLTFSEVKEAGFWEYNEFIGASPDRLVNDDGILEIKSPKGTTLIELYETMKLPPVYYWQVHGQLMCTGRQWCDFISFHPSLKPIIIRIERDEAVIKELETKLFECVEIVKQKVELIKSLNL
jgi:putative phage-type endonuclease